MTSRETTVLIGRQQLYQHVMITYPIHSKNFREGKSRDGFNHQRRRGTFNPLIDCSQAVSLLHTLERNGLLFDELTDFSPPSLSFVLH
jgi:hypothetical protein